VALHIAFHQCAKLLDSLRGHGGKKTAEAGAMGHLLAIQQRREGVGERGEPIGEGLQGRFAADGVGIQKPDDVHGVVVSGASTCDPDVLGDGVWDASLVQEMGNKRDFGKPIRNGGGVVRGGFGHYV
jgi:hypothetical protein